MNELILSPSDIEQLTRQGCSAEDWSHVHRSAGCDLARLHDVRFMGTVRLGSNSGSVTYQGLRLPCGIYDATIADCTVGDSVRIAKIGICLSGYSIGDGVHIENVATMTCSGSPTFGNGSEIDVWNEAGGRGILLLNRLTAQTAYCRQPTSTAKI